MWIFGGRALPAEGAAGVVAVEQECGCRLRRCVGSGGGAWVAEEADGPGCCQGSAGRQ